MKFLKGWYRDTQDLPSIHVIHHHPVILQRILLNTIKGRLVKHFSTGVLRKFRKMKLESMSCSTWKIGVKVKIISEDIRSVTPSLHLSILLSLFLYPIPLKSVLRIGRCSHLHCSYILLSSMQKPLPSLCKFEFRTLRLVDMMWNGFKCLAWSNSAAREQHSGAKPNTNYQNLNPRSLGWQICNMSKHVQQRRKNQKVIQNFRHARQ